MKGHYCGACGSTDIRHTLGPCRACGESLDGEQSPASRTAGMFHRRCWVRWRDGLRPTVVEHDGERRVVWAPVKPIDVGQQ